MQHIKQKYRNIQNLYNILVHWCVIKSVLRIFFNMVLHRYIVLNGIISDISIGTYRRQL